MLVSSNKKLQADQKAMFIKEYDMQVMKEDLNKLVEKNKKEILSLQSKISELTESNTQQMEEIEGLQAKIEEAHTETAKCNEEKEQLQKRVTKFKNEVQRKDNQIANLKADLQDFEDYDEIIQERNLLYEAL